MSNELNSESKTEALPGRGGALEQQVEEASAKVEVAETASLTAQQGADTAWNLADTLLDFHDKLLVAPTSFPIADIVLHGLSFVTAPVAYGVCKWQGRELPADRATFATWLGRGAALGLIIGSSIFPAVGLALFTAASAVSFVASCYGLYRHFQTRRELRQELTNLEQEHQDLKTAEEQNNKQIKVLDKNLSSKENEKNDLKARCEQATGQDRDSLQVQMNHLSTDISDLKVKRQEFSERLRTTRTRLKQLSKKIPKVRAQYEEHKQATTSTALRSLGTGLAAIALIGAGVAFVSNPVGLGIMAGAGAIGGLVAAGWLAYKGFNRLRSWFNPEAEAQPDVPEKAEEEAEVQNPAENTPELVRHSIKEVIKGMRLNPRRHPGKTQAVKPASRRDDSPQNIGSPTRGGFFSTPEGDPKRSSPDPVSCFRRPSFAR